ncbi:MAG: HAMP domain-containing histidine kinase [bacterium]|nr:HAMP domain-containing histidine kinase [bacterium]
MELNAAKDEFISLASHQLRTPATGVKQYVNMVLDGFAGDISPELRVYLEKINDSNERQLSVINDLLKVAQIDSGKVILNKENIDANKLITNIIHEQSSKFSARNQTLKFKKIKGKLSIAADATKLRMVIENVIDNASKYTPSGKNITIQLTRSQGMARIAIKDEGVGIAEEDIKKIFQKFQRLHNPMSTEVGGTGLGLYWVKKVVEIHGGTVLVTSKVNDGSTFTISLPLS